MKNVFLIHGFNGIPKIFLYFKKELEEKGYSIDGIGHMGKKSGLEELPQVVDIVVNG